MSSTRAAVGLGLGVALVLVGRAIVRRLSGKASDTPGGTSDALPLGPAPASRVTAPNPEAPPSSVEAPVESGVTACRVALPSEPKLTRSGKGYIDTGHDPVFIAWLKGYLAQKADAASGEAKRATLAFTALQDREGSTAAINTWDNQIFTWGTGFSGLGTLPMVMSRLVASSPAAVKRLADCGVKYLGAGNWSIDDGAGHVVTGKAPAMEAIRASIPLQNLFIALAKEPATREAVVDAQLGVFLASSGSFPSSTTIATQALYTFVSHLKHWAPGWAGGAVTKAAAVVPGAASVERDKQLAPAIVQAFYAAAPANAYIVKQWTQLKGYVRDMAHDGLDVTGDPVLAAASPPSKDLVS